MRGLGDRRGDRGGDQAAGPDRGHLRRDGRRGDVAVLKKLAGGARRPDELVVPTSPGTAEDAGGAVGSLNEPHYVRPTLTWSRRRWDWRLPVATLA